MNNGCTIDHFDFNSKNKFTSYGYFKEERFMSDLDFDLEKQQM